jgi:hypothetical protein
MRHGDQAVKAKIELTEAEIMAAIQSYIASHTGIELSAKDINIEVKSKQNYRSEWEQAAIRCNFDAPVQRS